MYNSAAREGGAAGKMTGVMHHPIDDLAQRRRGKPARRGLSWKRTFDVLAADGAHEVLLPPKPPHPRSRPTGGGCGNSPPREAFFVVCSASEPSEIQSPLQTFQYISMTTPGIPISLSRVIINGLPGSFGLYCAFQGDRLSAVCGWFPG